MIMTSIRMITEEKLYLDGAEGVHYNITFFYLEKVLEIQKAFFSTERKRERDSERASEPISVI